MHMQHLLHPTPACLHTYARIWTHAYTYAHATPAAPYTRTFTHTRTTATVQSPPPTAVLKQNPLNPQVKVPTTHQHAPTLLGISPCYCRTLLSHSLSYCRTCWKAGVVATKAASPMALPTLASEARGRNCPGKKGVRNSHVMVSSKIIEVTKRIRCTAQQSAASTLSRAHHIT